MPLDRPKNCESSVDVNGEFAGGSKRGKFTCELPGGLIKVVLPIDSEKTQTPISIEFDFTKWTGMDVRLLPHLDAIAPFFELVSKEQFSKGEAFIELEVFILGNRVLESTGDIILTTEMQRYSPVVAALRKAQEVANELGIVATVPADMGPRQIQDIEIVFGILKCGVHTFPTPHATLCQVMEKGAFEEKMDSIKVEGSEISTFGGGTYPFLSTTVDIGCQNVTFSAMTFDESQSVEVDSLSRKVVFVAEENCVCTFRQCTDSEIKMLAHNRPPEAKGDTPQLK